MTRHAKTEQDKTKRDKARQNLTGLEKKGEGFALFLFRRREGRR